MDPEMTNLLAAITSGVLTGEDRAPVLTKITSDPEAGEVLHSLQRQPELGTDRTESLPFPLSRRFRLGVCEGFFRVFNLDGLSLEQGLARVVEGVKRISLDVVSVCIPRRIGFDTAFRDSPSQIQLTAGENGDSLRLRIHAQWRGNSTGYFEIWEGGTLRGVYPADGDIAETGVKIPLGGVWAIRHSQEAAGIGFRVAEIEFTPADWIAAGVLCGMEGSFRQAVECLGRALGKEPRFSNLTSKAAAFVEALSGLTKVESLVLMPAAVTRSRTQVVESGTLALQPVWRGIQDRCPSGAALPELAALVAEDSPIPAEISSEWRSLIEATLATIRTGTLPDRSSHGGEGDLSGPLAEGWASLGGYQHLRMGAYRESLRAFTSAMASEEDPFGLASGKMLAEHLRGCADLSGADVALSDSNIEVWRSAMTPLISQSSVEEV